MRVGLVGLYRLQALVRLTGVDADDRDAQLAQTKRDRWSHAARLDHRAFDWPILLQRSGDRPRRAVGALCPDLVSISIDYTDVRRFHRQI